MLLKTKAKVDIKIMYQMRKGETDSNEHTFDIEIQIKKDKGSKKTQELYGQQSEEHKKVY